MNIKLFTLLLLFCLSNNLVNAQELNETEIIGTWKVVKIQAITNTPFSPQEKAEFEMLKKSFLKSVFHFASNHNFSFDFDIPEMRIKNAYWKYGRSTRTYLIQDWKNKNTKKSLLMEITVKKEGDKVIFLVSESFFELEMRKE